jgi:hypothetical protein
VQITIRLRRKARVDAAAVLTGAAILVDDVVDEIGARFVGVCFRCRHSVGSLGVRHRRMALPEREHNQKVMRPATLA